MGRKSRPTARGIIFTFDTTVDGVVAFARRVPGNLRVAVRVRVGRARVGRPAERCLQDRWRTAHRAGRHRQHRMDGTCRGKKQNRTGILPLVDTLCSLWWSSVTGWRGVVHTALALVAAVTAAIEPEMPERLQLVGEPVYPLDEAVTLRFLRRLRCRNVHYAV